MRSAASRVLPVLAIVALSVAGCASTETPPTTQTTSGSTEIGGFGPRSGAGAAPGGAGAGVVNGGPIYQSADAGGGVLTGDGTYSQGGVYGSGADPYNPGGGVYGDGTVGGVSADGTVYLDDGATVGGGDGLYDTGAYDSGNYAVGGSADYGAPGADALGGYNFPGDDGGSNYFVGQVGDTVLFETDSATLGPQGQDTLRRQAAWLQLHPEVSVTLEGHADERGTREYNLALGARRANAARAYLASLGVSANRIRTVSFGKERPVAVGSSATSWAQNRRSVTVLRGTAAY